MTKRRAVPSFRGMRTGLFVGVVLLWARIAAAGPWSVTPPPGWRDISDVVKPSLQAKARGMQPGSVWELKVYAGVGGERFIASYSDVDDHASAGDTVASMQAGALDKLAKDHLKVLYLDDIEDDTALINNLVVAGPPTISMRMVFGVSGTQGRMLVVSCVGPPDVCRTAVKSADLDRGELRRLPFETRFGVDEHSDAYKRGALTAKLLIFAASIIIVLGALWRRRRAT